MPKRFAIFILIALSLFTALNYYVGLRGYQWLQAVAPGMHFGWLYWLLLAIFSLSFFAARFGSRRIPRKSADLLTVIGGYWMAVWVQALPLLALIDLARLFGGWFGLLPVGAAARVQLLQITGAAVLLFLLAVLLYGIWNARHPVVERVEIAVPKSGGKHPELQIVLVSDTHFGAILGVSRVRHLVSMVGALHPDLILIAGDLIDDDIAPFIEAEMPSELGQLQSRLGTYAVPGNHDARGAELGIFRQQLKKAGITLLVDETVKVDDTLYLIGRDDISGRGRHGRPRKSLEALLADVDRSLPLILMDHQPNRVEEARSAGIDVQVSGHTHRGQFFPYHFVTGKIFEVDWGYLYKEGLHLIVSLGFGTWGPPIRLGNRPEIVAISVRFTGK